MKSAAIQLRVSPEVAKAVEACAQKQVRSVSNFVIWVLLQHPDVIKELEVNEAMRRVQEAARQ